MAEEDHKREEREQLLQELLADAASINHRFVAEPVFSKTGKGYLKSEGVKEIVTVKEDSEKD